MKIQYNNSFKSPSVPLAAIDFGDVFQYNGSLYLRGPDAKSDSEAEGSFKDSAECTLLLTGQQFVLCKFTTHVFPVKATVHVEI